MGRTLGNILLTAALSTAALAQTATQSTTLVVTPVPVPVPAPVVSQPTSGAMPLPAPPEAALPGSGTPVGTAPQLGVNDPRTGGTGAVIQPGVGDVQVGGMPMLPAPVQVSTPIATPQNAATAETNPAYLESGEASVATIPTAPGNAQPAPRLIVGSGAPTRSMSLGEFAAQLKAKKPLTKRRFDNSDIGALNNQAPNGLRSASEDLPQADQPQQQAAPVKPKDQQPDQTRVLDEKDLEQVQKAIQRGKDNTAQTNPK